MEKDNEYEIIVKNSKHNFITPFFISNADFHDIKK
jgi:hypothetical protein